MNGLKSLLLDQRNWRHQVPILGLQAVSVKETAERIALLYSDAGRPPLPRDLDALHLNLSAAADDGDFTSITARNWREAVWCLWFKDQGGTPLVGKPSFWHAYVQWMVKRQRLSDCRNLVISWLQDFGDLRLARNVAVFIQRACDKWPEWPWAKRHREWQIFDVLAGPQALALSVLDGELPVAEMLRNEGFRDGLQSGGYAEAAYVEMLRELPRRLTAVSSEAQKIADVERAVEWSMADNDRLRFPSQKIQLAEALLLPWHHSGSVPPAESQKLIQGFLLQYLGDPRLKPGAWFGIDDTAIHVFKRWLIGASLEVFINIIEQVAELGHWRYRKAFWMSYFKRDYIADAWIALGRTARHLARNFEGLRGNYAMLERGGVLANHSVLIMKIGDLVIADWSHNGTCRIWRREDPMAPSFYKPKYYGGSLKENADYEIRHHGSQYGTWQATVSAAIRDKTGLSVPRDEYMP